MDRLIPVLVLAVLLGAGCSDEFTAQGGTVTDSTGVIGSANGGITMGANLFPQASPTLSPVLPTVQPEAVSDGETADTTQEPIALAPFIDLNAYAKEWAVRDRTTAVRGIQAGVVNHHALAGDLLVTFMRTLQRSHPQASRFIILSPDHFMAGRSAISTTNRAFQLQDTTLSVDAEALERLLTVEQVQIDNGRLFEKEHGIGAVVAYLTHAFPTATIVPIALQSTMKDPQAVELGRALADIIDAQTVVIVSADMSHYLPEATAFENDRLTLAALATLDAKTLGSLNDDYTDNRPSFVALRAALDERKIQPVWTLLDHSISSRYGGSNAFTTSYITGFWSTR